MGKELHLYTDGADPFLVEFGDVTVYVHAGSKPPGTSAAAAADSGAGHTAPSKPPEVVGPPGPPSWYPPNYGILPIDIGGNALSRLLDERLTQGAQGTGRKEVTFYVTTDASRRVLGGLTALSGLEGLADTRDAAVHLIARTDDDG
jgi:hypothetical protein